MTLAHRGGDEDPLAGSTVVGRWSAMIARGAPQGPAGRQA
jgi:hypothetical protein